MDRPELSALYELSRENYLVRQMLEKKLPFTREHYIELFYEGEPPAVWTDRHEALLPPCFRQSASDLSAMHEAIEKLGEAIGVTYTGRVPR